jgi:hypothetical protein
VAAASIRHAQADAHDRLEGGLLDLAGVVRRLEVKLDRLAEAAAAQYRPPDSALRRRSGASAHPRRRRLGGCVQQQGWSHTGNEGMHCSDSCEEEIMLYQTQSLPTTNSASCKSGQESEGRGTGEATSTRSLFDVIDKVCSVALPPARGLSQRTRSTNGISAQPKAPSRGKPVEMQSRKKGSPALALPKEGGPALALSYPRQGTRGRLPPPEVEAINGRVSSRQQGTTELSPYVNGHSELEISHGLTQDNAGSGSTTIQVESESELKNDEHEVQVEEGRLENAISTDVERKLDSLSESMSRKLERIAYALGIRNLNVVDNSGDDAEDRKRLMEKLKSAFDNDRLRRFREAGSEREQWLEYVFGICKPDQRVGKR